MSLIDKRDPRGSCIISEDVVASIASSATLEIPGVAGMSAVRKPDLRELVTAPGGKSVWFSNNEEESTIDVYVDLYADVRIPDAAEAIQKNVKAAVQSMTGTPITKVNVHVMGVKAAPAAGK